MTEKIHHPAHYNLHPSGIEAWDVCEQLSFNLGNAIKYLFRAGLKEGDPKDQDLSKARAYLARATTEFERHMFRSNDTVGCHALRLVCDVVRADVASVLGQVLIAWQDGLDQTAVAVPVFMLNAFDAATEGKFIP